MRVYTRMHYKKYICTCEASKEPSLSDSFLKLTWFIISMTESITCHESCKHSVCEEINGFAYNYKICQLAEYRDGSLLVLGAWQIVPYFHTVLSQLGAVSICFCRFVVLSVR